MLTPRVSERPRPPRDNTPDDFLPTSRLINPAVLAANLNAHLKQGRTT
jgi:hypothetical protein